MEGERQTIHLGTAILRALQLCDALSSGAGGCLDTWQVFVREYFMPFAVVTFGSFTIPPPLLARYLHDNGQHLALSGLREYPVPPTDHLVDSVAIASYVFGTSKVEVRGRLRVTFTPAAADQTEVLKVAAWHYDPDSWEDWHRTMYDCDDEKTFDLVNEDGITDAHLRFLQIADTLAAIDFDQLPGVYRPVTTMEQDLMDTQRSVIEWQARQTQNQVEAMHLTATTTF